MYKRQLQVEGRYNYQIYRQDVHKWGSSSGVRWDYVKDEVREEASLDVYKRQA